MPLTDNIQKIWAKFSKGRTENLFNRFNGWYRAVVVETNDPLQMYRVRVKCPELHDADLKPEECPWAERAPWMGGKNAGQWYHPIIGDIVWIVFEKNHPYNIVWVGFAMGTRRKRYPLESIYTESPLALKFDETADEKPDDFIEEYLPKDFRPMSNGIRDRYGSTDIMSSVGYYPIEHIQPPAQSGTDALSNQQSKFAAGKKPEVNNPDRKYLAKISKYGVYSIQSDIGYYWRKKPENEGSDEFGEFSGDFDKDRTFEIKRYKYLTRLLNEDSPNSGDKDQRRYEVRTRAGHKIELRDVGWAQAGGGRVGCDDAGETHSRDGEYDDPRVLSKWKETDERWLKLRTKGGHLIQAMDMGFHPELDEFYKRKLIDEVGAVPDEEYDSDWVRRDARQIRIVTRHGFKFVLDDRGTDGIRADKLEKPRGNGWLLKTRRSWQTTPGDPRGFAFEAIDKDELDTTRWYTPKSKIIELNDRKDYVMMCTDTKTEISREWRKLKENEFALKIAMTENPESDTYHLKLDKANRYLRLKTAAGHDNGRRPEPESVSDAFVGLNQGFEARDDLRGDGPWVELVDAEHRGFWFSRKNNLGVWRAKQDKEMYIAISDLDNVIIIRNNANGPIQIFSKADIEIISEQNIVMKAGKKISMKAGTTIDMESAGSGHAQLSGDAWTMDVPDNAPKHTGFLPGATPGGGAQSNTGGSSVIIDPQVRKVDKREPGDRGKTYNDGFGEVSEKIVRACE